MGLVSIKDYAKNKGVTHQSVYQMMKTHEEELKNYIVKQGRTRYLTEEAIEILEKYSNVQVVIERAEYHEEVERLKEENKNLLIKVAAQADKIAELSEWKADQSLLIAEAHQTKILLEEKKSEIQELKEELEKEKNKGFFARLLGK